MLLDVIADCQEPELCGRPVGGPTYLRNRHCPRCQTNACEKWLAARQRELLPVGYYHLVFSVPHALVLLIWQNKKLLFKLLFEASAATMLEVAADRKHLGAEIVVRAGDGALAIGRQRYGKDPGRVTLQDARRRIARRRRGRPHEPQAGVWRARFDLLQERCDAWLGRIPR